MHPLVTPGFHHVTMVSGDAGRTLTFYRELLGLELVKMTVNYDDPTARHLYFGVDGGLPGTILTFFEWSRAPKGGWGVGGVHHIALSVPDRNALLKWKRRLTDVGISVMGPLDRGYFESIYFADPDGQILEIATAGPGYAFDEPADALGAELIEPAAERLAEGRDDHAIQAVTHPEAVPEITDDMRLRGIHHVSALTHDLERAGEFLEETLGLRLVKRTFNQDDGRTRHFFWAHYDGQEVAPGSSFTLFDWAGSTLNARAGAGQTHHVAFRAQNEEEQLAWREHVLNLGYAVSEVQDRRYFKSIYFRAPDGLLLEVATDGPGFAVDESPDDLGSTLQLPEWLESERGNIERGLVPL